ncbi:DUF2776 family protein [Escherichia coli]|uniref:DUF2776 family protein n=1 Tax=Escherichia coli TaxID=562 RepID=UPI0034D980BB
MIEYEFVAAHLILGVVMIPACESPLAAESGQLIEIPKNAEGSNSHGTPVQPYTT